MAPTYGLAVHFDSYEYRGEFRLLGDGCETPGEVLRDVAADHILRICNPDDDLRNYLLDVLDTGDAVSESRYENADVDTRCTIFAEPYYLRASFDFGEGNVQFDRLPSRQQIEDASRNLDEHARNGYNRNVDDL